MKHEFPIYLNAADAGGSGSEGGGDQGAGGKPDELIPRSEAEKAFRARDEAKKRVRELEARVMSEEDVTEYRSLKEQMAKADEERKRKAGEFDSWRTQITTKHEQELAAERAKAVQVAERFKQTVIKAEFGAATDYFGAHDGAKTILDVDLGMAALGRYVEVQDAEDDPRGYRVVVKGVNGQALLGRDGNPAPFGEAMAELINQLPNKDRILRGSGKTGSGSSGGSTHSAGQMDLATAAKRVASGDKDARAVLERASGDGSIRMGWK
jgi:hypothetical protein